MPSATTGPAKEPIADDGLMADGTPRRWCHGDPPPGRPPATDRPAFAH
jgi:hypothetical protein